MDFESEGLEGRTISSLEEEIIHLRSENARLRAGIRSATLIFEAVSNGDLQQTISLDDTDHDEDLLKLQGAANNMTEILEDKANYMIQTCLGVVTSDPAMYHISASTVDRVNRGIWREVADALYQLVALHVNFTRSMAEVLAAVARGDLSRLMTMDVRGETLELKVTINAVVESLRSIVQNLLQTTSDVGSHGRSGVETVPPQATGVWQEVTQKVNGLSSSITQVVRAASAASVAVTRGNLNHRIHLELEGEMTSFVCTFNAMVDTLAIFASELERATSGDGSTPVNTDELEGVWLKLANQVNATLSDQAPRGGGTMTTNAFVAGR